MAEAPLYDPPEVVHLLAVFKGVRDWYTIGLKLNLATYDLDIIKDSPAKEHFTKVFRLWLDTCSEEKIQPSWQRIIEVLDELHISKPLQEIRKRYRPGESATEAGAAGDRIGDLPSLDDRPTVGKLLCLRGTDQNDYHVIQELSPVWENLAYLLEMPRSKVALINRDYDGVEEKCRQVFVWWLDGAGGYKKPVTWNTLLAVLEDIEHAEFAKQLRKHCLTLNQMLV